MLHYWSLDPVQLSDCWLTIGSFDGVHLGHQQIISNLTTGAHQNSVPAVVLTFYPHPVEVLRGANQPFYLTPPEKRTELIGKLGVDVVITYPFNRAVANTSARDFIRELVENLHPTQVCVGHDFALGRNREGTVDVLRALGEEFGYQLGVYEPIFAGDELVSSSRTRSAIREGDVENAALLLGRPHSIEGEVVHGDARGGSIGIPTANLNIWERRVIPAPGVYACLAHVDGEEWGAVTNIGFRPTFPGSPPSPQVEAHLLDFDRSIYGRQMELHFLKRLRDERRFSGVEALVAQIRQDISTARELLSEREPLKRTIPQVETADR